MRNRIILTLSIFIFLFLTNPDSVLGASRFWVGGGSSTNWNATVPTNWSTTSGGSNNASVPTSADDVIFDANSGTGTSNISSGITVLSADFTNFTGTLTHAAVTLTVAGSLTFGSGMTYTPNSGAIITISGTCTLTSAGKLLTTLNLNAATTLADDISFSASKTNSLVLSGNYLNMAGYTISGNSTTNRILIKSSSIGTQRTITRASGAFANADFRDIDLEAAYDASGITGGSGDSEGNSADFTFTTAQTNYWVGGTGSWSDVNEWASTSGGTGGTGRVPLPQDNVRFDANSFSAGSQTVTLDMTRAGKSIDWTGVTNTPAWTKTTNTEITGSLTMVSGMTNSGAAATFSFTGRGAYTLTLDGQTFTNPVDMNAFGGSLTLQDAYLGSGSFFYTRGTFDANDFNFTSTTFVSNGTQTRVLNMGSGTWTLTGTVGVWNIAASNLTLNEETSTIVISNTTATAKTFTGASQTYNNLTITGSNVTITGSNTFNNLALNNAGLIGTKFTQSTTQTLTTFEANGSGGSLVYASSTAATNATLTKSGGGTICEDYLYIKDLTGSPASTWYAGANSTDGGDNTNWTFTACPSAGGAVLQDEGWFMLFE